MRGWIRYPAKGSKVCKFGRKSGFTCGVITDSSFSWRGEGNLVVTKNAKSEGGDSGGPVFSGHTAYGVHMGTAYWGKRQVFTRLNGFADRKTRVLVY